MRFNLATRDNKLAIILAPVFVIAFPFVNLFIYHHYSFLNPEVGVLFFGVAVFGLLLGLIHLSHPIVRTMFLSLLVTLALTLQLDLSLYFLLGIFILMLTVGTVLQRSFSMLTIVFFLTMSIAGLVQGSDNVLEQADVKPRDPDLPIYIHVVFDGHIGIDGIPLDVPGGQQIKQELTDFFTRHGFTQYNKAYSRYVATINSLGNLFDFTNTTVNNFRPHDNLKNQANDILRRPKYFQILNERGYALRIVHPYYLDYCSANTDWVSYCYQYPDLNLQSIEDSEFSIKDKINLALELVLKQSDLAQSYYQSLRRRFVLPELEVSKVPGVNAKMMQVLFDDLRQHSGGYAHVWHLLFPHAPLVYADDCTLQAKRPFKETRPADKMITAALVDDKLQVKRGHNTTDSRAVRYQHYFSQVRCGLRWFEQMLTVLREIGAYDDAIIVVHGDHGSKISKLVAYSLWKEQLQTADYIDTYSTLFAIKWKNSPTQNTAFLSLNEIFTESINKLFSINLHVPTEPYVYMQSHAANSPLQKVEVKDFLRPVSVVQ